MNEHIEKAKEILKKEIAWMEAVNWAGRVIYRSAKEILAELEAAESKPEPMEFLCEMRDALTNIRRSLEEERSACHDDCMCNICIAKQQVWEAEEQLKKLHTHIDSLQEQLVAKDKAHREEIFRLNDKCVEMCRARDKKIERLTNCLLTLKDTSCSGDIELIEQALMKGE